MVNKLRAYTAGLGGGLVLLSAWAVLEYGVDPAATRAFLGVAAVGVGVAVVPVVLAHGKRLLERRRHLGLGGVTYVSAPVDADRQAFVERTASLFAEREGVVDVKTRSFREGQGFIVDHTAFHGTFIRLTRTGHLVVTGVTEDAARTVVDALEAEYSTPFRSTSRNPLVGPIPVRGAPRAFLAIGLTALVVVQVLVLAGAAYPSDAYNPGERAYLVGIDLHTQLSPTTSETDGRLDKARFLVSVVREQAVEQRWAANRTAQPPPEPSATVIAAEVERLLAAARADEPNERQRARIVAIERDLAEALEEVERAHERAETSTSTNATAAGGVLETTAA